MDARLGWLLAVAAVALATWQWGWQGTLLGGTVVVFWLLLQFSRSLRVLRNAGQAPKGRVANAVMLHSQLKPGMTLLQILPISGSLGEPLSPAPDEAFAWQDAGGDRVVVRLSDGRVREVVLERALQNAS